MKKFALSCLLIGAVFAVPLAVSFAPSEGVLLTEKRKMNEFPDMSEKFRTRVVRQYFKRIELWFTDRVPLRENFVALAMNIEALGGNFDISKCIRGKDGWLFLGNDYAHTVDALEGKWRATQEQLENQVYFYTELNRVVRECGAELHVLVGPNKSSIYPEYLPPIIFPAEERAAYRLCSALQEKGISVFDPTDFLKDSKSKGILYWRTDTHWNELGVKLVLEEWFRRIGQPALPKTKLRQEGVHKGDLISIGSYYALPLQEGDSFTLQFVEETKTDASLLILGDSFSNFPEKFFKRMYSDTTRIHTSEILNRSQWKEWLKRKCKGMKKKSKIVFWIHVERDFITKAM